MNECYFVANRGQAITSTNYWDSEAARAGLYYLSWNAGAARLLVPDGEEHQIQEMSTATFVSISQGPLGGDRKKEVLELLFDDKSEYPFLLFLGMSQTDRRIHAQPGRAESTVLSVWTRGGEQMRRPASHRLVRYIAPAG
jgi:hypothetical protein